MHTYLCIYTHMRESSTWKCKADNVALLHDVFFVEARLSAARASCHACVATCVVCSV